MSASLDHLHTSVGSHSFPPNSYRSRQSWKGQQLLVPIYDVDTTDRVPGGPILLRATFSARHGAALHATWHGPLFAARLGRRRIQRSRLPAVPGRPPPKQLRPLAPTRTQTRALQQRSKLENTERERQHCDQHSRWTTAIQWAHELKRWHESGHERLAPSAQILDGQRPETKRHAARRRRRRGRAAFGVWESVAEAPEVATAFARTRVLIDSHAVWRSARIAAGDRLLVEHAARGQRPCHLQRRPRRSRTRLHLMRVKLERFKRM